MILLKVFLLAIIRRRKEGLCLFHLEIIQKHVKDLSLPFFIITNLIIPLLLDFLALSIASIYKRYV